MKTVLQAVRLFAVLTLITGLLYPLFILATGQLCFPRQANGSLLYKEGAASAPVGSLLLSQKTESPRYFWPRPSAADYATLPSGASNLGPTSQDLKEAIAARRASFAQQPKSKSPAVAEPAGDLLTTSGSGLDPHLSPLAAEQQVPRVAAARQLAPERVRELVAKHTEPPQFGFLGEPRVNVLSLNLALEQL